MKKRDYKAFNSYGSIVDFSSNPWDFGDDFFYIYIPSNGFLTQDDIKEIVGEEYSNDGYNQGLYKWNGPLWGAGLFIWNSDTDSYVEISEKISSLKKIFKFLEG